MQQNILAYGTSIALAGLAAQLQSTPGINVSCARTRGELGNLAAYRLMIIDMNETSSIDLLAILRTRPALPVVGLNTSTGSVTVFSGQVYLASSIEEVIACLPREDLPGTNSILQE